MIKTDVCIIGAGPSGASTSLMLSKMKINHYIVDKSTFPRDKTCGDGLILYAYKSLLQLDQNLFKAFLENPKFIHSKTIKLHINDSLNVNIKESEDRDMVITYAKRFDFDYFLVSHLSKKYANSEFGNGVKKIIELDDGILVKLKDGKEILAKIIVGADGVNSIVSRKLADNKPNKKLTSTFVNAYFKNVTGLPKTNDAEIRLVYRKTPLFFYVFPLADGSVNVSLGARTDLIKKYDINLLDEIKSIINSHKKVAHKFKNASIIGLWRGWSIPFDFNSKKVYGKRFLLVGDAAGLTNAFYKEGVGTGMMSGIICAKKIALSLEKGDFSESFLATYQNDLNNEFSRLLRFSHLMVRMARYKYFFASMVLILKNYFYKKIPSIIKRKSY
ncbi:FAD-dependent monooxygenase [Polaribacter septentrionalilitoris]|uniref:FAD-dependent monooxygenase n=1 Tax=Polaribacter septentrionalilitoris TaxID=2494657 RepID=UPI00135C5B09|nr:NAD(P)/FAD-dependent oxidoreductase [Polaribacter septentrionalilitoris]